MRFLIEVLRRTKSTFRCTAQTKRLFLLLVPPKTRGLAARPTDIRLANDTQWT
jgi:hypothetical protein